MEIKKISKTTYRKFADKEMELFFEDFFGKNDGKNYYRTYSSKEKKFFFAATKGKKTAGVVSLRIRSKTASIGVFVVAKDYRGAGVGSDLLEKCEDVAKKNDCTKIWLWTLPNIKSFNFYKKKGYKEEARLKKHWGGKDLCVMGKFF